MASSSRGRWPAFYTAEETRDPERTLPRALAVGVVVVTGVYLALNAAYLYVLPLARVSELWRGVRR